MTPRQGQAVIRGSAWDAHECRPPARFLAQSGAEHVLGLYESGASHVTAHERAAAASAVKPRVLQLQLARSRRRATGVSVAA